MQPQQYQAGEDVFVFRGTTLQTGDNPIIQYLAFDPAGELCGRVDIFHDGRCLYHGRETAGGLTAEDMWSYGGTSRCTRREFEAMKNLARKLAAGYGDDPVIAEFDRGVLG